MTGSCVPPLPPSPLTRVAQMVLALGAVAFIAGAILVPETASAHLLLVGFFGLSLGLAGALLVALQYVTSAGWSVGFRRVPEAMIAALPVGGALVLAALVAFPSLYPWTDPELHLHGDFKHFWLQRPFFLLRAVVYLGIWVMSACVLVRTSRRQDVTADPSLTFTNRRWSAVFLLLFGVTFWLASYDWLMSREPEWVSTIYALCNFAGLFTSGLASLILLLLWLRARGPLHEIVTTRHLHDLGKLLFGMCVFWLYLWYCQYMLIWFVNNPEETPYYLRRLEGHGTSVFYLNVVLNGVIPFFVLLPRAMKESPKVLANVCGIVLLGRWLDLYLMILPGDHGAASWLVALAMTGGALASFFLAFHWSLGRAPLVPTHDPFLIESVPSTTSSRFQRAKQ